MPTDLNVRIEKMVKQKRALYLKIYEKLLVLIEESKRRSNITFPSENELALKYGVNRHTIRKSLQKLKDEGVIYTKKGSGNYITNISVDYSVTDKSSFSLKVEELGYRPKTIILSHKIIKADLEMANFFQIAPMMDVLELKLLRYADDLPIYVTYSYFDAFRFSKLIKNLDMEPFSLYRLIKHCYPKLDITKTKSIFEAIRPSEEIREYLELPLSVPILKLKTISKDQDSNPVEFGIGYLRGDTCSVGVKLV